MPRPCAVDGCSDAEYARSMCRRHYRAWWNNTGQESNSVDAPPAPHPNPWVDRRACPECGDTEWTMPFDGGPCAQWSCSRCGHAWTVALPVSGDAPPAPGTGSGAIRPVRSGVSRSDASNNDTAPSRELGAAEREAGTSQKAG